MQHSVQYGSQAYGLGLDEKLLSQYLNELGYDSHTVGKVTADPLQLLNLNVVCNY